MLDFISNCKQTIIKYKKQLFSLALIPVFMFRSSLSGFAATVSPNAQSEWFLFPFDDLNTIDGSFDIVSGNYHGTGSFSDSKYLMFTDNYDGGVFPGVIQGHRYLYYFTYTAPGEFDYNRTIIRRETDDSDFNYYLYPDSLGSLISYSNTYVQSTTTITGIVDFVSNKTLQFSTGSALLIELKAPFSTSGRQDWALYLLDITDSSESEVNQIVTAINNQTNSILNAGSGFGGTSSGILSGNDELSGFIDDYTEIEQSMYDKFSENQSSVIGNFSGFSWGSLSTAVDWTSDYLNRIYDNSGDFRTMFMYPILAGIALIFIGRQGLTAYVRSRREK